MQANMKYLLKLLIIIIFNICVIGFAGHIQNLVGFEADIPAISRTGSRGNAEPATFDSDYYLLARLISAESRGEPYSGQVAVGAVILNRVQHPSFPDSIAGVAYQPGAFASLSDVRMDLPIAQSAYRAAKEALNGCDPSGGALYYYADGSGDKRLLTKPVIKIIGNRRFCK